MKMSEEPNYQFASTLREKFFNKGMTVFMYIQNGQREVARAISNTMARRIAAALNRHVIGKRGY